MNKRPNTSVRLSLCMIVKNEEQMLPKCLASIKGIVDEIVIVDTGSTDGTREAAADYNIAWFSRTWDDDFSAARNYSIEKASGDWVLVLDADETVTGENARRIRDLVETGGAAAYYLNFRSVVRESAAGNVLIHSHARLFKNGLGIRFKGRLHEQIVESVTDTGGIIEETDIVVDHAGYRESRMADREKTGRNIRILLKELQDNPGSGSVCFYLGESYSLLGEWNKAIDYYEKGAESAGLPPINRALLLQNLGSAYYNTNDLDKALEREQHSLSIECERITPRMVIAEIASAKGAYDLAVWEWNMALDIKARMSNAVFRSMSDFIPEEDDIRLRIAETCYVSGDYQQAQTTCRKLIERAYRTADVRKLLIKTLFALEDFSEVRKEAALLLEIDPDDPEGLILVGKIEGNLGNLSAAETCFNKVLELNPDNDEARSALADIHKAAVRHKKPEDPADRPDGEASELSIEKKRVEDLLREGKSREARVLLLDLAARYDQDYELYFLSAFAADMTGDHDETIEYCGESLKRNRKDPRVFYLLGNAYSKKQLHDRAITEYEQAVKLRPDMFEAWTALGVSATKLTEYQQARESFEQAHKLKPDDIQIKKNLAAVCAKLGLDKKAEYYLRLLKM
ncbi:tetratricopeptide repeat protein [candidate division KSB1 bacterium]